MTTIEKTRDANSGIVKHYKDFGDSGQLSVFIPRNIAKGNLRETIREHTATPYYGGPGRGFSHSPSVQRFRGNGVDGFIVRQISGLDI